MYRNNLINFLDIKNFSEKTCTVLDSYLRDMSVVRPEKFSVSISKVNNEILIEPTIVKRVSEENGSYSESEYVVDAEWSENFKKRFHALNEVSNVYRGENNTKIVLSPEQKEGLRAVKRHSRFSGREKSEFFPRVLLSLSFSFFSPSNVVCYDLGNVSFLTRCHGLDFPERSKKKGFLL